MVHLVFLLILNNLKLGQNNRPTSKKMSWLSHSRFFKRWRETSSEQKLKGCVSKFFVPFSGRQCFTSFHNDWRLYTAKPSLINDKLPKNSGILSYIDILSQNFLRAIRSSNWIGRPADSMETFLSFFVLELLSVKLCHTHCHVVGTNIYLCDIA